MSSKPHPPLSVIAPCNQIVTILLPDVLLALRPASCPLLFLLQETMRSFFLDNLRENTCIVLFPHLLSLLSSLAILASFPPFLSFSALLVLDAHLFAAGAGNANTICLSSLVDLFGQFSFEADADEGIGRYLPVSLPPDGLKSKSSWPDEERTDGRWEDGVTRLFETPTVPMRSFSAATTHSVSASSDGCGVVCHSSCSLSLICRRLCRQTDSDTSSFDLSCALPPLTFFPTSPLKPPVPHQTRSGWHPPRLPASAASPPSPAFRPCARELPTSRWRASTAAAGASPRRATSWSDRRPTRPRSASPTARWCASPAASLAAATYPAVRRRRGLLLRCFLLPSLFRAGGAARERARILAHTRRRRGTRATGPRSTGSSSPAPSSIPSSLLPGPSPLRAHGPVGVGIRSGSRHRRRRRRHRRHHHHHRHRCRQLLRSTYGS